MVTKYIFVTEGVVSSLEKGIISSALARLLLARGFSVTIQRLDPCFNLDSSTLNPLEHGECYVTEDGHEADMILGHYERFTGITMTHANHITAGRIYQSVINKERRGDFGGEKVQVVPHITDEIKQNVKSLAGVGKYDFVIVEIGGRVGEIESSPFLEAVKQLKEEQEQDCIHLTDILFVKEVQDEETSIYEMPLMLHEQHVDEEVLRKLGVSSVAEPDMAEWKEFLSKMQNATSVVNIGLVGDCADFQRAYKSITETLLHTAVHHGRKLELRYINSENLNDGNVEDTLAELDGIVVAPGLGRRGVEGRLTALKWCREHDMPTLGICMGMQCMVVEFARNVLGIKEANSSEWDVKTPHPVVDMMEEQKMLSYMGGLVRLGAYRCRLEEGSVAARAYGSPVINERHRHHFEFNDKYRVQFEGAGMKFSGVNPETNLVDVVEIPGNTWYVGTQYHPEFNSTVLHPNALLKDFISAVIEKKNNK